MEKLWFFFLLRKLPGLTTQDTAGHIPVPEICTAGIETASWWVAPVTQWVPTWLLTYPIQTRFPMAKSQISHSIKPFIHGAVAQEQPELVPLRWIPNQGTPGHLYPHSLQKSPLPPESLAPAPLSVSIHLAGSLVFLSFATQKAAIPSSPVFFQRLFTWLVSPTILLCVIPKAGSPWPLFSGSYPDHLSLQLVSWATWNQCTPQQSYSKRSSTAEKLVQNLRWSQHRNILSTD